MGILYEHWRPDLNECFYVGASWQSVESRPYEMSNRSDDHIAIQDDLASKGLATEVRLIECSHLTDDELDTLEALQIVYWKDLIGDRLVNKAKGGRMGLGFGWSDEMRKRQSETMTVVCNTPEHRMLKSIVGKIAQNRPDVKEKHAIINIDPEVKAKKKASQRKPETVASKKILNKLAHANPETKAKHKAACKEAQNRPETKAKHQAKMVETNRKRKETFRRKRFFIEGNYCLGCA